MKTKTINTIVVFLLGISAVFAAEPVTMKKWEYKIWLQPDNVHVISHQSQIEKELNSLGSMGWELVTVMWKKYSDGTSPNGRAIYYFKREVKRNPGTKAVPRVKHVPKK